MATGITTTSHTSLTGHLPIPEDYGVSRETGFLPSNPSPLLRLPGAYFEPWEQIMENLQALLLAGQLRARVAKLAVLDASRLQGEREFQRAYVVLSFISHGYIWGKNQEAVESIPPQLAIPWVYVSRKLGLKPVNSYASTTQYNYRLIDPHGPFDLTNLALKETFTGSMDEAWFFLVPVAIEALGGPAIAKITRALEAVITNDVKSLTRTLLELREIIDKITAVLVRMYENCDPHTFFTYIRPYLAGWAGYTELMPNGLLYEGTEGVEDFEMVRERPGSCLYVDAGNPQPSQPKKISKLAQQFTESMRVTPLSSSQPMEFSHGIGSRRKYAGGSAAQSPIIHCLDMALGVEHQPQPIGKPQNNGSEIKRPPSPTASFHSPHSHDRTGTRMNFITEMRAYMPGSHREYLYALAEGPSIRKFVTELANAPSPSPQDLKCVEAYDSCIEALKVFRDKHLQVVAVYIIIQGKKRESGNTGTVGALPPGAPQITNVPSAAQGIAGPSPAMVEKKSLLTKGTGGTNILPFLRQAREETDNSRIKNE